MNPRYRQLLDPDLACDLLRQKAGALGSLGDEQIEVADAAGRVTAEAVRARFSSPPYHAAAMDGIAVLSAKTAGATATTPVVLMEGRDAVPIDTGDPIPSSMDAVIPVENIQDAQGGGFQILSAAPPRQHVRLSGEDMVAGEIILPRGRLVTPAYVGALLGAGVTRLAVRKKPVVAVIPTGDELCEPGEDPRSGKVIESNSRMLSSYIHLWGGTPLRFTAVADEPSLISRAILQALTRADLVLVLAGSSAGRGDFTPQVIAQMGQLLFQGLGLMPGKPTSAGLVDGKLVIGVPGFPVSAAVAADRLVRPLIAHWLGVAPSFLETLSARLLRSIPSRPGVQEVIRVMLGKVEDRWIASPLSRGAGAISSLAKAHGTIEVASASEGISAGSEVEVSLLVNRAVLEGTLLFAGSSDLALAVLDDMLSAHSPGSSISVNPVGSLGGLAALARGEAHLAGCHLLDPKSGTYNFQAVSSMLPGRELMLVTLAHRSQGLCLRADDPRRPRSLQEVVLQNMRFVNRQPGSGTRVLVDHLLIQAGKSGASLPGYDHEEFTHLAVAEAVRTQMADCGMVIQAAAQAAGLHFIPISEERYDLVVPSRFFQDRRIQQLIQILLSEDFKKWVLSLGGYDTRETGKSRKVTERA